MSLVEILNQLKKLSIIVDSIALRTNKSLMVEVDLTTPHTNMSLNLEHPKRVYRWLTIEQCDDSLTFMLKQTDGTLSNPFRASEGARIYNHDFLDVIVSNPASSKQNAICRFIVGYWED